MIVTSTVDTDPYVELACLESWFELPNWAYLDKEIVYYTTTKYKLLGKIREEEEYNKICNELLNEEGVSHGN